MSKIIGQLLLAACVLGAPTVARADPPAETAEDIVCRGLSAVGFSYAWGGECWCAEGCAPDFGSCNAGSCSGNCPSCTHSGTYGADCSGFVSRAWQVPSALAVDACGTDRYVASNFASDHAYWDPVSLSSLQPADAAATSSHVILIVGARDGAGEYDVVEAQGCSSGIIHHRRSISTSYHGARRINLVACSCDDGGFETRECGDCGSQERACDDGCNWSSWSACEGPDPTGAESPCTVPETLGTCAEGRRLCVAGWLTCAAQTATEELCDGLDNDCDGVVDNGTPESLGEGVACTSDCGPGELQCLEGALQCVTPDEACDGGPSDDGGPDLDGEPSDDGSPDDSGPDDSGPGPETPDYYRIPYAVSGLEGGCACRVDPGTAELPLVQVLALLGLLAWRRRVRHP